MPRDLVTIGKYLDITEAHIAAGLLRSEGIPVYPQDVDHLSANPFPGVGLGGTRLQVPAAFEQAAREALARHSTPDDAELDYLATGKRSEPDEKQNDQISFGIFRISDRVRHKSFWVKFILFDIVFFALVLLLIWANS